LTLKCNTQNCPLWLEFVTQPGIHSHSIPKSSALRLPWLHFSLRSSSVQKDEENPMFWEFLFSCSFSSFSYFFWKCQKEHLIWGKLKEKEKLAKLLLFHVDSQTLVKAYNQHNTVVNYSFLHLWASSQQCKQMNTLHCWLATSPSTWLTWFANLLSHGHHDIAWLTSRGSHSIQTFKSTCTICWSHCSWINNVDDFFQKYAKLFRSESCFLGSRKWRKMLWIMLPRFPAGTRNREIGSKRKGKRGKAEFLKRKCNQDSC